MMSSTSDDINVEILHPMPKATRAKKVTNYNKNKLTPKQIVFVQEYARTANVDQAIRSAGYSNKRINQIRCVLLANKNIQMALERLQFHANRNVMISFEEKIAILVDHARCNDREISIRAVGELNKMQGHYAPTKNVNVNLDMTLESLEKLDIDLKDY